MIADGIKAIAELASKSVAGTIKVDCELPNVYYLRGGDGTITRVVAPPPPRNHSADSLKTVTDFANRHPKTAAIWIEEDSVTCLVDEGNHYGGKVSLLLPFSAQFAWLVSASEDWKSKALSQPELVLLLRTLFDGCTSSQDDLLGAARNVRFRSTAESTGVVERGRASVGKSIEQEVSGAKQLPDSVVFSFPVFADKFELRFSIRVAIEINMSTEKFYLIPIPGEVEKVHDYARKRIASSVLSALDEGTEVRERVYFGRP
jgi:hypothetical protein